MHKEITLRIEAIVFNIKISFSEMIMNYVFIENQI